MPILLTRRNINPVAAAPKFLRPRRAFSRFLPQARAFRTTPKAAI